MRSTSRYPFRDHTKDTIKVEFRVLTGDSIKLLRSQGNHPGSMVEISFSNPRPELELSATLEGYFTSVRDNAKYNGLRQRKQHLI